MCYLKIRTAYDYNIGNIIIRYNIFIDIFHCSLLLGNKRFLFMFSLSKYAYVD